MKTKWLAVITAICIVTATSIGFYYFVLTKFTVRVGYLLDSVHQSSYFVSKAKDLWLKAGVAVAGFGFISGPHEMDAFWKGELDVGFVGVGPAVTAISNGAPVRIIASVDSDGSALVVRKDLYEKGLKTINGLHGKVIAFFCIVQATKLLEVLQDNGVAKENVTLQSMSPDLMVSAMGSKKIDAFMVWEPYPSVAVIAGIGVVLKESSEIMWLGHPCCCLVASVNMIKNHPDVVRKMLEIDGDATKFVNDNPPEAADIVAEQLNFPSNVVEASYARTRFVTETNVEGTIRFEEILYRQAITRKPTIDELFDFSFSQVTNETLATPSVFSIDYLNTTRT